LLRVKGAGGIASVVCVVLCRSCLMLWIWPVCVVVAAKSALYDAGAVAEGEVLLRRKMQMGICGSNERGADTVLFLGVQTSEKCKDVVARWLFLFNTISKVVSSYHQRARDSMRCGSCGDISLLGVLLLCWPRVVRDEMSFYRGTISLSDGLISNLRVTAVVLCPMSARKCACIP